MKLTATSDQSLPVFAWFILLARCPLRRSPRCRTAQSRRRVARWKNTRYRTAGRTSDERQSISVPTIEAVLASNNAPQEQRSMPGYAGILVALTSESVAISCAWRSVSRSLLGQAAKLGIKVDVS
jgi:hypothetical protein